MYLLFIIVKRGILCLTLIGLLLLDIGLFVLFLRRGHPGLILLNAGVLSRMHFK